MENQQEFIRISREAKAQLIPSGDTVILQKGQPVKITQALGGSYTLYINGNLVKLDGADADAIGKEPAKPKEVGADFGAGFDGDADRCGFVDNEGNRISMDIFFGLIAKDILSDGPATILYDLRSSKAVKECIEENGGTAIMCRVGHAFIKAQMRETGAIFAGELSGHYYFKENNVAESQGLAMIKLANLICKTNKTVSELTAPLRKYYASGEINSKVADVDAVITLLKEKYSYANNKFELDGFSFEFEDWWFNVRCSNTEPLLRLNVEADAEEKMRHKRDEILAIIRS